MGVDLRQLFDQFAQGLVVLLKGLGCGRLAEQTGLSRVIEQDVPGGYQIGLSDRFAWTRLMDTLGTGEALAGWLGRQPPRWDCGSSG